jgi:hypothetical protein
MSSLDQLLLGTAKFSALAATLLAGTLLIIRLMT